MKRLRSGICYNKAEDQGNEFIKWQYLKNPGEIWKNVVINEDICATIAIVKNVLQGGK